MIILGILTMTTGTGSLYFGVEAELGSLKYLIGLFFIILGVSSFYIDKKNKSLPEFSKCPECKETYEYPKLEEGLCPKCKIKTIDMEKYYDNK